MGRRARGTGSHRHSRLGVARSSAVGGGRDPGQPDELGHARGECLHDGGSRSTPWRRRVSATVVAKTGQYAAGYVAQGGTYYVYANATDGGAFPSGIATVRADVSVLTAGATSVRAGRRDIHRRGRQLRLSERGADRSQPARRGGQDVHADLDRQRRQQSAPDRLHDDCRQHRSHRVGHPDDQRRRDRRADRTGRHDHLHVQRGHRSREHPRRLDGRRDRRRRPLHGQRRRRHVRGLERGEHAASSRLGSVNTQGQRGDRRRDGGRVGDAVADGAGYGRRDRDRHPGDGRRRAAQHGPRATTR